MIPAQGPLVSLIVPACDAEHFIERTLRSLLAQTYSNLEIIVIDDGSRDGTAALVRSIRDEDPRVVLVQQANLGVAAARNAGIERARGALIGPVDADDLWFPRAVEQLVARIGAEGPEVGIVYAWSVYIDEQDRLTGGFRAADLEGDVFTTLLCHNFLGNASCTMIRRECIDAVGGYDRGFREHAEQGCEDWDFYLRLSEHYQFRLVPEFLVGYRKIRGRMSSDADRMASSQAYMLQKAYGRHPLLPGFLSRISKSSFYIYLAQECGVAGRRAWLQRALSSAPLFCLLRPRFHQLWLAGVLQPGPRLDSVPATRAPGGADSLEEIRRRRWRLHTMLIGQRVFHALLSLYRGARPARPGIAAGGPARGASDR